MRIEANLVGASLVAFAAVASLSAAVAARPQPIAPIPRIVRIVTPPVAAPATFRTEWLKASHIVRGKRVDFLVDGDRAAVLEWPAGERYGEPRVVPLENSVPLLAFLADRRYEFLWAPLTDWAGADLARFRERLRRQAETLSQTSRSVGALSSAESVVSGRVADFIRLTAIYMDIGEALLAQAVMEKYLAATRPRGGNSQRSLDWVIAKARLASVLQFQGKIEESFPHYDDIQRVAGRSVQSVNGAINHAAILAEAGRYSDALQIIDSAWAMFRKEAGEDGLVGSERQFAWIRACALNGLGRIDEATATYETLRESGRVSDRNFIVPSKESIEWRAHWCMRRKANLKQYLLDELRSERPTLAVLAMQPAYKGEGEDPVLLVDMRADPEIRVAIAVRMRELPAPMLPAMNKYR